MKKYFFIICIISISLYSCAKEEGEGGRSSITGTVHMNDITGGIQGEYNVPDYDIYIIYGDENNIYDDRMRTNYDGTFQFKNLREGSYRIYAYTRDITEESGVSPVFKSTEIGGNEEANVGTIEVEK
ncbi:MAG: hypothetical protein JKX68_05445 [Flavobacteriales bacterium]|nr:hypothetical protein [Flavobacteriales bacterium]